MEKVPQNFADLLVMWKHRTRETQRAHYEMALRADRKAFWCGVISAVISGFVGVLLLVTEQMEVPWLHVAIGAISVLASVMAAIVTAAKWNEKAAQHQSAGASYGSIHRRLERALALPPGSADECNAFLDDLRNLQDSLPSCAPAIPGAVWAELPMNLTLPRSDSVASEPTNQ